MRSTLTVVVALIVIGGSFCSYEVKHKTEVAVEQAAEKFHQQLNEEQYQTIYYEADAELRNRVTEAEFTDQLRSAHEQLGRVSGKVYVFIDDSVWRALRNAFGTKREIVAHRNFPASDTIMGDEQFAWAVESDAPKLLSYKLQRICSKPCRIVFGSR